MIYTFVSPHLDYCNSDLPLKTSQPGPDPVNTVTSWLLPWVDFLFISISYRYIQSCPWSRILSLRSAATLRQVISPVRVRWLKLCSPASNSCLWSSCSSCQNGCMDIMYLPYIFKCIPFWYKKCAHLLHALHVTQYVFCFIVASGPGRHRKWELVLNYLSLTDTQPQQTKVKSVHQNKLLFHNNLSLTFLLLSFLFFLSVVLFSISLMCSAEKRKHAHSLCQDRTQKGSAVVPPLLLFSFLILYLCSLICWPNVYFFLISFPPFSQFSVVSVL